MSARFRTGTGTKRKRHSVAAAQHAMDVAEGRTVDAPTPLDPREFQLLPEDKLPKRRRQPGEIKLPKRLRAPGALYLPGGARLVQRPNLPPSAIPGQSATQALFFSSGRRPTNTFEVSDDDDGPSIGATWDEVHHFTVNGQLESNFSRHRRRRIAQHANWRDVLNDALLLQYMKYKHNEPAAEPDVCTCVHRRRLAISWLDWSGVTSGSIEICACRGAAEQLVARGYFPCAPKAPSLAFSFELLEMMSIHSLHVAPNVTAWSETLDTFWARRGTGGKTSGRLRKRLGMALTWYQVLENRVEQRVSALIIETHHRRDDQERQESAEERDVQRARGEEAHNGTDAAQAATSGASVDSTSRDVPAPPGADVEEPALTRPTVELRNKCQLCFGGARPPLTLSKAHVIVCLDANFAQKRRKCAEADPPLNFEPTRFLGNAEITAMESELARRRKAPPKRRRARGEPAVSDEVLNECEQSFIAAQEKITKASKNYYADTGLMALLCRHDRVLWVVNMSTPGERQHYALALLRRLGEHLPKDWFIGLLYDIACQLGRSIEKFGLLPELEDRFIYAVSVFHAYGHQWACQIVFHPRKRVGFGLSDGEGCERFWSAIRHLIACLRVSGFYRRLFILDRQIHAMNTSALSKIAVWLRRKHSEAVRRLAESKTVLDGCGVPIPELRAEWKAQVEAQLKKPPRQDSNAADKTIDEILVLMGLVDDLRQQIRDDRKQLRKAHTLTSSKMQSLSASIESAHREIEATESRMAVLHATLGTERTRRFESMRGNAYICARVKARALRATIRNTLVHHKFEHRKLERGGHQVLQASEHAKATDLINRRERTIGNQVRAFNKLVDDMALLARQGKKPDARTRLPRKLEAKKLFKLDVDDDIWQEDIGLGPQGESDDQPRWLTEEDVKRGILALQQWDRCREEMERLDGEVAALASWWQEERVAMETLIAQNGPLDQDMPVLRAAVKARMARHEHLRVTWARDLSLGALGLRFTALMENARHGEEAPATIPEDVEAAVDSAGTLAGDDIDSDDASDAYPEPDDENEALDELLVELALDSDVLDANVQPQVDAGSVNATQDETQNEVVASHTQAVPEERQLGHPSVAQASGQHEDNDDDNPRHQQRKKKKGAATRIVYRAGEYTCDDEDLDRFTRPCGWLSGNGLAVFLQQKLLESRISDVSIIHSRTLLDVNCYVEAVAAGDAEGRTYNRRAIIEALQQAVHPVEAKRWLVLGHVAKPPHWTLLEIRWIERTVNFYDSYAAVKGYAADLANSVRALVDICGEHFDMNMRGSDFLWIGERRDARQDNGWDCGPFVAADAVSLIDSDCPSVKAQDDMVDWRRSMAVCVRALRVEEPVPVRRRGAWDDAMVCIEISD